MSVPLGVVVPVYDEAQVLAGTLEALARALDATGEPWELVVVDDGSQDATPSILAAAAQREPRLRVETHPVNRGKGAAVRTGMLAARADRLVFLDADLSVPLEELGRLTAPLDAGNDIVLGNRRAPGAAIVRRQPWPRETLGKGFTLLTRLLLAPGVTDFTCGFKAFRREAAHDIFRRCTLDGWAFDAELVVVARARGYRIAQVPVTWHHGQDTKVRIASAVAGALRDVLAIAWRRARGAYR